MHIVKPSLRFGCGLMSLVAPAIGR
jgi:hypothetical protein